MKKTACLLFVIMISLGSFAQGHWGNFKLDPKMKKAPYAFVWIEKGKTALKQSEVSVDDYLTFLEAVTRDSSYTYVMNIKPSKECALYPFMDTSKTIGSMDEEEDQIEPEDKKISWIDEGKIEASGREIAKKKGKDYDSYFNTFKMPITGISYEQALEYAKWCTVKFNQETYQKSKNIDALKQVTIFRLPTPKEFEELLKKGIENCTEKDPVKCTKLVNHIRECKNEKGCALCNCAGKDTCIQNKEVEAIFGPNVVFPIYSYHPSWINTYNMRGNAAEMTSEFGTAMGGSYLQVAKDCLPGVVQNYTKPEKWLGFRLIAEVVELDEKNYYFDDKGRLIVNKK